MHDYSTVLGETGSTKSNTTLILTGDEQRIVVDIQKDSTARKGFDQTGGIYEDLDGQTGMAMYLDFKDPRDREAVIETLLDRRHSQGMDFHPQLEAVTDWFFKLVPNNWDMRKALRIFRRREEFDEAMELADSDTRRWWLTQPGGGAWERITAPTERLCTILGKPAIASRLSQNREFIDAIDEGHSYYVDGGRVISDSELRFILKWRVNEVLRYKKEGGQRAITIVLEESESSGVMTPSLITSLLTLRKTGTKFVIVAQTGNYGDDRINEAVWSNTNHIFHRIGSYVTAEKAARDLTPMLDPRALKEIQQRLVMVGDEQFLETRNVYFSIEEQYKQIIKCLMNLQPGEAISRIGSDVRLLRLPELQVESRTLTVLPRLNWEESESSTSEISSEPTRSQFDRLFD